MLGLEAEEVPWRLMDEFTPPAELQRLTREWDAFLATGEAEGRLQLYLTGVGERSVEFSATANVAPGRHLLVFLDPERPWSARGRGVEASRSRVSRAGEPDGS